MNLIVDTVQKSATSKKEGTKLKSYLQGYLASIPQIEYSNIISFLEKHMTTKLNLSEEEFKDIIKSLTENKTPATQRTLAYSDERPKDTYNRFFSNVSIDLVYLFKVINALNAALDSYSYLSSSYLADIKSELDKLEAKIIELKTKREYDNNTIVVSETFRNTESFESYNSTTSYLFADRNGSQLELVDMVHKNTDDMITLKAKETVDMLHNANGKTIGIISVLDYRGVPIDTYSTKEKAIDNSETSYWDCTVISDNPISTTLDDYEEGGAYIKFSIKLAKTSRVSEISISPFCIYPVEISDIIIEGKSVINQNSNNVSTETMTFNFHPITTDEVIIVMRQRNYVQDLVTTNDKIDEAIELLNLANDRTIESFVTSKADVSEYKDDNVYLKYANKKEQEIAEWNSRFIRRD